MHMQVLYLESVIGKAGDAQTCIEAMINKAPDVSKRWHIIIMTRERETGPIHDSELA